MSTAYKLDVGELTTVTCGVGGCAIAFAIPSHMERARRQDGKEFYCPNGHYIAFGNTENARLKKELEQTQKRLEWSRQEVANEREATKRTERARRAVKGVLTRTRKRVSRGCCTRCATTFPDLAAHMSEKHPEPEK